MPRQELKADVAADIRAIFNAPNRTEAAALLARTVEKYAKTVAKRATWLETAIPEGLTVLTFPEPHRRLIRTTNGLERLNQEIRRRTRVVGIFPNEASCLRLVSALAMEVSDEWEVGKVYLTLTVYPLSSWHRQARRYPKFTETRLTNRYLKRCAPFLR